MQAMDKPTCAGKVWSRYEYTRCHKAGTVEHDGKMWCKTHHPPSIKAREKAREARSEARFQQYMRERREKNIREELKMRALDWMRNEDPEIVEKWERELNS